jgi:hypothetical protein
VNTSSTSNPKSPKFSTMFHTETSSPHQVSFPVFYYVYVFLLMPISQVKGRWIWCRYCTELEGLNWRIVNRFFVPSHSFIAGQWSRRLLIFQLVKAILQKKLSKVPHKQELPKELLQSGGFCRMEVACKVTLIFFSDCAGRRASTQTTSRSQLQI